MANRSQSGFYASLQLFRRHHYIIPGCLLCRMNGGDDALNDLNHFLGEMPLSSGKGDFRDTKNMTKKNVYIVLNQT